MKSNALVNQGFFRLIYFAFFTISLVLSIQLISVRSAAAEDIYLNSYSWPSVAMSSNGATLIGATSTGDIVVSKDSGVTWNRRLSGTGAPRIVKISANGERILVFNKGACGSVCVSISVDSGLNWTFIPSPNPNSFFIFDAAISQTGQFIYVANWREENKGYIWYSNNFGTTWQDNIAGGSASWTQIVTSGNGQKIIAADTNREFGSTFISESSDAGNSFTTSQKNFRSNALGLGTSTNGYIGFTAWENTLNYLNGASTGLIGNVPCIAIAGENVLFAGERFLYLSGNGGASFNPGIPSPLESSGTSSCAISENGQTILVGRAINPPSYYQGNIFISNDGGQSFTAVLDPPDITGSSTTVNIRNGDPVENVAISSSKGIPSNFTYSGSSLNGMVFDSTTGNLSGNPINSGNFTYTITGTNTRGSSSAVININVVPVLNVPIINTINPRKTGLTISFTGDSRASSHEVEILNSVNEPAYLFNHSAETSQIEIANALLPDQEYTLKIRSTSSDQTAFRNSLDSEVVSFSTLPLTKLSQPTISLVEVLSPARIKVTLSECVASAYYVLNGEAQSDSSLTARLENNRTPTCLSNGKSIFEVSEINASYKWNIEVKALGDNSYDFLDSDFSQSENFQTPATIQIVISDIGVVPDSGYATATINSTPGTYNLQLSIFTRLPNEFNDLVEVRYYAGQTPILINEISGVRSYLISGLTPSREYKIEAIAYSDGKEFYNSPINTKSFTTNSIRTLNTPEEITITPYQKSTRVVWSIDLGASTYKAYLYTNGSRIDDDNLFLGNSSPATINNLNPDLSYEIEIKAIGDGISYSDSTSRSQKIAFKTRPNFIVQYNTNEGLGSDISNSEFATEDISFLLPPTDLVKDDYLFAGWSEQINVLPVLLAGTSFTPTSNKTLYAVWINSEGKYLQRVLFNSLANMTVGLADQNLTATASSGFPIVYSSLTPSICSIVAQKVRALAAGSCEVAATQNGKQSPASSQIYESKSGVKTFVVSAAPVTPTPSVPPTPNREPRLIENLKPTTSPSTTPSPEPKPANSETPKPTSNDTPKVNNPGITKPSVSEVKINKDINLQNSEVKLRSATGQEVKGFKIKIGADNKITVTLPKGTKPGVYKIQIKTIDGKTITKRIVVKKK